MLTLLHLFKTKHFPISQMRKVRHIVVKLLLHVPYLLLAKPGLMLSDSWVCTLENNTKLALFLWMDNSICDNYQSTSVVSTLCLSQRHWQSLFRARRKGLTGGATEQLRSSLCYICCDPTCDFIWKELHWTCWRSARGLVQRSQRLSARSQGYFLVPHGYRWKSALLPAALTHTLYGLKKDRRNRQLLREPKVFKQLALYPYGLWTRMGLYTVLKLGQFL